MTTFREKYPFEERKREYDRISQKFPEKIPVILDDIDKNIHIDKCKFLVSRDITFGQFVYVVRKRCSLNKEEGLFFFIDNTLQPMNESISIVYKDKKDKDGFLYVKLTKENTFG